MVEYRNIWKKRESLRIDSLIKRTDKSESFRGNWQAGESGRVDVAVLISGFLSCSLEENYCSFRDVGPWHLGLQLIR
jgi:hypothetical protein